MVLFPGLRLFPVPRKISRAGLVRFCTGCWRPAAWEVLPPFRNGGPERGGQFRNNGRPAAAILGARPFSCRIDRLGLPRRIHRPAFPKQMLSGRGGLASLTGLHCFRGLIITVYNAANLLLLKCVRVQFTKNGWS
jgi:hypothetical protein